MFKANRRWQKLHKSPFVNLPTRIYPYECHSFASSMVPDNQSLLLCHLKDHCHRYEGKRAVRPNHPGSILLHFCLILCRYEVHSGGHSSLLVLCQVQNILCIHKRCLNCCCIRHQLREDLTCCRSLQILIHL